MRFLIALLLSSFTLSAFGAEVSGIDSGDTGWIMVCTALVMLMTPGLAFFYSGMVSKKNVVSTLMHSYMKLCTITLVWVICGYSIAFGTSWHGIIGGFEFLGFNNVGTEPADGLKIPHIIFAMFQGMFAVVTAAIITGSFAERVRLSPILLFSAIWTVLVYAPVAHWVWGGGWVHTFFQPLDFAGGAVVHINSAVAGLVAALYLGRRVDYKPEIHAHNIPLTVLGASLLWFGWFGFNAGSALASNGLAALALVNTNIAAAAGGFAWFAVEMNRQKKVTAIGIISGSVAGLVAVTPAAGFVKPWASIIIGGTSGIICYWSVGYLKPKLRYDDSLDAFGIHGVGGIWGAIATGLFATTAVNPDGANGLFYGNASLLWAQVFSSLAVMVYSAVMTLIILKVIRLFVKVRVSKKEEAEGLDNTIHGENGYNI